MIPAPNKERIRLLVDALRSGQYQQGTASLTRIDREGNLSHCCLGVACDVAINNGLEGVTRILPPRTQSGEATHACRYEWVGEDGLGDPERKLSTAYLPIPVMNWFGFPNENPSVLGENFPEGIGWEASYCNDVLRMPFSKIADAFEHTFLREAGDAA